ncbi:MAG: hypothetical protein SchgKO_12460 [Schleiferiaceae bacterium]
MAAAALVIASCSTPAGTPTDGEIAKANSVENHFTYEAPLPLNTDIMMRDQWSSALSKLKTAFNQNANPLPKSYVIQIEGVLLPMHEIYTTTDRPKIDADATSGGFIFANTNLTLAPGARDLFLFMYEVGIQPVLVSSYGREVLDPTNEVLRREGLEPVMDDFFIMDRGEEESESLSLLSQRTEILGYLLSDIRTYYPQIESQLDPNETTLSQEMYEEFASKVTIIPVGKYRFEE